MPLPNFPRCERFGLIFAGVLGLASVLHADDNIILQSTTVNSGTVNQSANVSITATNNYNVNSGAQVNLTAGILVHLTTSPTSGAGVHIVPGASSGGLHAIIDFNRNGTSDAVEYTTRIAPPYTTGFESGQGFSIGLLNGQGNWFSCIGSSGVNIIGALAYDGTQSVDLPAANPTNSVIKHFTAMPGQPITYLDFFVKPAFTSGLNSSTYIDVGSAQIGFLQDTESSGRLQVLTANSQGAALWLTVGPPVALTGQIATNWQHITLRLNYSTRQWDLYLNQTRIASSLSLNSVDSFMPFFTLYGSTVGDTYFDAFQLNSTNPLQSDAQAPAEPTGLTVYSLTSTSVSLFWAPSTDTLGVQSYTIYRDGTVIGSVSGQTTYYTDLSAPTSGSHSYTVEAVNTAGATAQTSTSATVAASLVPLLEVSTPLP